MAWVHCSRDQFFRNSSFLQACFSETLGFLVCVSTLIDGSENVWENFWELGPTCSRVVWSHLELQRMRASNWTSIALKAARDGLKRRKGCQGEGS